jgi:hypothetical protein
MTIEAAQLIARVRADLTGLEREMARAETIIQNAAKGMETKGNEAGQGIGRGLQQGLSTILGPGAGMLLGGAAIGGLAMLGKQIMGEIDDMAALGMQSERVGQGFTRLWGEQAPAAMEKLRAASRGTISDMELELAGSRATMLQVTDDADELAALLEVAATRGRALGIGTQQAFNDIVTGIGRLSPLILDNLGIITDAQNTYDAYAQTLGKAAGELTEAEKRQALVNRVLQESGEVTLDAAGKMEALEAAKENLRAEIGLLITEMINESDAVEGLTGALGELRSALQFEREASALAAEAQEEFSEALMTAVRAGAVTEREYQQLQGRARSYEVALRDGRIAIDEHNEGLEALIRQLTIAAGAYTANDRAMEQEARGLYEIATAALEAASAVREYNASSIITTWRAGQPSITTDPSADYAITTGADALPGGYGGGYAGVERRVGQMEATREAEQKIYQESLKVSRSYYSEAERQAEQHYREMRSMIETQLQMTSVTREDMLATQLGLYQDKPDEYLRRLRSAVQDEQSEWKHLLEGRSGAEAEYYLMQQEQAFQQGRWGELGAGFDQGAAVESIVANVRAQIEAERNRAALIDQIMQHPDLAGVGLGRQEIAAMAGLPTDYRELGTERGTALAQGITTVGAGTQFVAQFEDEFTATRERWVDMGILSVTWLAQGIERGVTPDVAALLVRLLAPRVEEALSGGRRP